MVRTRTRHLGRSLFGAAERRRIAIHRNVCPGELVAVLRARAGAPPYLRAETLVTAEGTFEVDLAAHGAAACLESLAREQIDAAVMSLQPTLGIEQLPAEEAATLHAAFNRGAARLVARSGGQLRAFSAGVVVEGFQGLCVAAPALLDLERLASRLDELEERHQVLFVHPGPAAPIAGVPAWWAPAVDYTAQMQAAFAGWLAHGA